MTRSNAGRVATVLAALLLGPLVPSTSAHATTCGDTITGKLKLETDLYCYGTALVIGASGVEIDLGGHTLYGLDPFGDPRWSGVKTIEGVTYSDLKVKNGTISSFDRGVDLAGVTGAMIEGITFDRQVRAGISVRSSRDVRIVSIRATETSAVNIRDSANVAVRKAAVTSTFRAPALLARTSTDVTFSEVAAFGPSPWGRTDIGSGILFDSVSNGVVNHALVSGYKDGVLFQCSGCAPSEIRNSGAVLDSTFMDDQYGIDMNGAAKVRIAGNTMLRNVSYAPDWGLIGAGIMGGHFARVADLEVVDNSVSDSLVGIVMQDLTSSRIDGNVVTNTWQAGIVLGTGLLGTGSSGNTVSSNIVAGAPPDLWAQEGSAGNTWKDNTCRVASGEGVTCALVIP